MKNITFTSLEIKNFMSIGNDSVKIEFKTGLNIITGINLDKPDRQNAIGKSSIIDSVYFTLYGESLRKVDKLEQLCNYRTKKPLETKLEFTISENNVISTVKIIRQLKPSKVQVFINNEDKTLDSIKNNNLLITRLLNYDSEAFRNCISMSLNNTDPFMLKAKQQKREFIESIFNLGIFSHLLVNTKNRFNTLSKDFDIESARYDEISRNIITYGNQQKAAETEKNNKLTELRNKVTACFDEIKIITVRQNELKAINFEEKYSELDTNSSKLKKVITDYRFKIEQNVRDIAEIDTKVKLNIEAIANLCSADGSREIWETKLKDLNTEIEIKDKKLTELKLINFNALYTEFDLKKSQIKLEISNFETQKDILSKKTAEDTTRVKMFKQNLESISKQLGSCPTCKRPFELHDKEILENEKKCLNDSISEISNNNILDNREIVNLITLIKNANNQITLIDNQIKLTQSQESEINKVTLEINKLNSIKAPIEQSLKNEAQYTELIKINTLETAKKVSLDSDMTKSKTAIVSLETLLTNIESSRKSLDKQYQEITTNDQTILKLNDQIGHLNSNITDINTSSNQFSKLIEESTDRQNQIKKQIDTLKDQLHLLDQAKFVFSEEGVKSYLIKKTLDLFNNRLAYYLKQLDSKYMCFFNEYFEEEILNSLGETYSYFNLSGAERKTIDFACLFTFMDIRRLQGDVSINVSFYDELLDTSLDTTGIEIVLNVLRERIEKYNESMFIISHRKESAKFATGDVIYLKMQGDITSRIDYSYI